MAEPFLAEIRIMSFNFPPKGWAFCNGQLQPINQNQALFSLLGTDWGGDGRTNFALPDLRGKVPIHVGPGHPQGPPPQNAGGEQAHTLTIPEMPEHVHLYYGSSNQGTVTTPAGNVLANSSPKTLYEPPQKLEALSASAISPAGGNQPHENMQPYLTLAFCIALQGIFPSPT